MENIPEAVTNAIAAVMAEIPKLSRDATNQHAKYNFASIDDFLDAVRPLCAKHKLVIVQNEASFSIAQTLDKYGKPSDWLQMSFAYTVATAGASWGPIMRTIMVRADMGSQAFGAAQSYSLKQFMRSLFQISTGDGEDADSHEQSSIASAPVKDQFPEGPHKNKSALDRAITAYCGHIAALTNEDDLETYIAESSPTLAQYRLLYGRNSEHWEAIVTQNTNARARVKARSELPADAEPMQIEPIPWPETVTRMVTEIGNRETSTALEAWFVKSKLLLDELGTAEKGFVRGAYTDRLKAIKAMETASV